MINRIIFHIAWCALMLVAYGATCTVLGSETYPFTMFASYWTMFAILEALLSGLNLRR